jgi:hypothetical protein
MIENMEKEPMTLAEAHRQIAPVTKGDELTWWQILAGVGIVVSVAAVTLLIFLVVKPAYVGWIMGAAATAGLVWVLWASAAKDMKVQTDRITGLVFLAVVAGINCADVLLP